MDIQSRRWKDVSICGLISCTIKTVRSILTAILVDKIIFYLNSVYYLFLTIFKIKNYNNILYINECFG